MGNGGAPSFTLMAKPSGPDCNLDCAYCFYKPKLAHYSSRAQKPPRMSSAVLELYVREYLASHPGPEVLFIWQGGEPLLMGRGFYRRAFALQTAHCPPDKTVHNSVQTNGILLDDAWCNLFAKHSVLLGVSLDGPADLHNAYRRGPAGEPIHQRVMQGLDGPADLHDAYRRGPAGEPTHQRVMQGLDAARRCGVEYNVLCAVHAANQHSPQRVYEYLRDEAGAQCIQCIPIVEKAGDGSVQNPPPGQR